MSSVSCRKKRFFKLTKGWQNWWSSNQSHLTFLVQHFSGRTLMPKKLLLSIQQSLSGCVRMNFLDRNALEDLEKQNSKVQVLWDLAHKMPRAVHWSVKRTDCGGPSKIGSGYPQYHRPRELITLILYGPKVADVKSKLLALENVSTI